MRRPFLRVREQEMFKVKKAVPTVVTTPLPSGKGGAKANQAPAKKAASGKTDPYLRAANEDDDGYDPYSDRREEAPLFEANPWD